MAAKFSNTSPFSRLLNLLQLEKKDIWLLLVLTFGFGVLSIATPVAVQALVNIVTMGGVLEPLWVISFILLTLLILAGTIYIIESYVVELIQRRLFIRTAIQAAQKSQGVQLQVYDHNNPVELMNRFFDVGIVQKSIATLLTVGLMAALQGIIGSVILVFYSVYFLVIVLLLLLFVTLLIVLPARYAIPTAIEESATKYQIAAWLESIARNLNTFKFFNGPQHALAHTERLAHSYLDARSRHFRVVLLQNIAVLFLYALIGTAMLALGGALVIQGQINLGQFVASELIIFSVLAAFVRLVSKLGAYYDMLAALDKLGALEDLPQEVSGQHRLENGRFKKLSVHQLGFAYSEKIRPIVAVTFELQPSQSLAILGASGAGKSTLLSIVTGLRAADTGQVRYDETDIRQLNLVDLRRHIAMVSRLEVIEDSILENVRLGRGEITLSEINQMLTALGLMDDIAKLSHGIDTMLTATGAPLSTTQLQRMMLARAMVGSPALLLIDGLLDNLNKQDLSLAINALKHYQHQGILMVSTRLENVASQFEVTLSLSHDGGG